MYGCQAKLRKRDRWVRRGFPQCTEVSRVKGSQSVELKGEVSKVAPENLTITLTRIKKETVNSLPSPTMCWSTCTLVVFLVVTLCIAAVRPASPAVSHALPALRHALRGEGVVRRSLWGLMCLPTSAVLCCVPSEEIGESEEDGEHLVRFRSPSGHGCVGGGSSLGLRSAS